MVAVDESQESMYALSWCLANLVSDTTNVKLVLLYVKPPPSFHSLDAAGFVTFPPLYYEALVIVTRGFFPGLTNFSVW